MSIKLCKRCNKEGVPKSHVYRSGDVVLLAVEGQKEALEGYINVYREWRIEGIVFYGIPDVPVTHWIPKPELPKEGE